MSARPRPESLSPFLALVGDAERNPLRLLLWIALGLPLAAVGLALVVLSLHGGGAPSATAVKHVAAVLTPARRLIVEIESMAVYAVLSVILSTALLGAAQVAFERRAWTFATPVRPFALGLMGLGAAVFAGLFASVLGLEEGLTGQFEWPPLVDPRVPLDVRSVCVLSAVPIVLLSAVANSLAFRGLLLQVMGAFAWSRIGLCVLNGVATSLFPLDSNPVDFVGHAMFGAVLAWSVLELGGIEFSVGALAGANLSLVLLSPPPHPEAAFRWSDLLHPASWIALGELGAISALALGAVALIKRSLRLSTQR